MKEELIKIYKDGDKWCCMAGKNLQEGFSVFADTEDKALDLFNERFECFMSPDCPCDCCQKENIKMD